MHWAKIILRINEKCIHDLSTGLSALRKWKWNSSKLEIIINHGITERTFVLGHVKNEVLKWLSLLIKQYVYYTYHTSGLNHLIEDRKGYLTKKALFCRNDPHANNTASTIPMLLIFPCISADDIADKTQEC